MQRGGCSLLSAPLACTGKAFTHACFTIMVSLVTFFLDFYSFS